MQRSSSHRLLLGCPKVLSITLSGRRGCRRCPTSRFPAKLTRQSIANETVATPIVARIDELFAVDDEARRKALSVTARHVRRQETAKPLLDDIRSKIDTAQSVALPSSALSKACQYALTL